VSFLTGITGLQTGADTGAVSFINAAASTNTLSIVADPAHAVTYTLKNDTTADSLTLNLGTATTTGFTVTGGASIGAIETVSIASNGTLTAGVSTGTNALALTDAAVTTLNVSGAESLTLTGLTGNTVTTVHDTMGAGSTLTLVTAATATAGATVTDGDGSLVFTGAAAATKVDMITAGNGNDTITEAAGTNTVTLGNGTNVVSLLGSGNQTVVVGTGLNGVTLGTGQSHVTFGAHASTIHDTVILGTATSANAYSVIAGLQHGDSISFGTDTTAFRAADGTATAGTAATAQIVLNPATAAFADYIAAAVDGVHSVQGEVSWFQFGGNTFIVEQHSATHVATFTAGTDNIVELVGLVNLAATASTATVGGAAHTIIL
jgi:S-layer protein